jgi:hypothetical protein
VQVGAGVPPAPFVWNDREGREVDVKPSPGCVVLALIELLTDIESDKRPVLPSGMHMVLKSNVERG